MLLRRLVYGALSGAIAGRALLRPGIARPMLTGFVTGVSIGTAARDVNDLLRSGKPTAATDASADAIPGTETRTEGVDGE